MPKGNIAKKNINYNNFFYASRIFVQAHVAIQQILKGNPNFRRASFNATLFGEVPMPRLIISKIFLDEVLPAYRKLKNRKLIPLLRRYRLVSVLRICAKNVPMSTIRCKTP